MLHAEGGVGVDGGRVADQICLEDAAGVLDRVRLGQLLGHHFAIAGNLGQLLGIRSLVRAI